MGNFSSTLSSPLECMLQDECHFEAMSPTNLNVHQRSDLWHKNKQKKIEKIRESTKDDGLEECTFKPKLAKKSASSHNLRGSASVNKLQTMSSIQKYEHRMNKAREIEDIKQIQEDKRVGSGKNWTHRITVPREPSLSYQRSRSKGNRKKVSVPEISRELMARNISLESIKTKEYIKDSESPLTVHNHF